LYWLLRAPYLCNVGAAWLVGALVDLGAGSLLGQHALAFTLTAYVALSFQRRLVLFSETQVLAFTFSLLVLAKFTVLILKLLSGNEMPTWHYFWPTVTGILFWLVIKFILGAIAYPKSTEAN
jgi:rod shape-determining protein MreD